MPITKSPVVCEPGFPLRYSSNIFFIQHYSYKSSKEEPIKSQTYWYSIGFTSTKELILNLSSGKIDFNRIREELLRDAAEKKFIGYQTNDLLVSIGSSLPDFAYSVDKLDHNSVLAVCYELGLADKIEKESVVRQIESASADHSM